MGGPWGVYQQPECYISGRNTSVVEGMKNVMKGTNYLPQAFDLKFQ